MHTETHHHHISRRRNRGPVPLDYASAAPPGPSPIAALRYLSAILSSGRTVKGSLVLDIVSAREARTVIDRALRHHHHEWCMAGECGCGRCVVCGELAEVKIAESAAYFAVSPEIEEDICTGCGEPLSG